MKTLLIADHGRLVTREKLVYVNDVGLQCGERIYDFADFKSQYESVMTVW